MLDALLGDEEFCQLMKKHGKEMVELLLKRGVHFSVLTNIADVTFDPELPPEIRQNFKPITMFYLAGYTFESTQVYNGTISFEAGFGSHNFGSLVTFPLESILQIIVEEVPIFINLGTASSKKAPKEDKSNGLQRSMSAFLSNPHNQKLIKK